MKIKLEIIGQLRDSRLEVKLSLVLNLYCKVTYLPQNQNQLEHRQLIPNTTIRQNNNWGGDLQSLIPISYYK